MIPQVMDSLEGIEDEVRAVTDFDRAERIEKGFSFEEKYLLSGTGEKRYVARISPAVGEEGIRRKRTEFEAIRSLRAFSILVPEAYSFGVSCDGESCHLLLEYMEGTDLEEAIPQSSEDQQYELGLAAGRELLNLHRFDAPFLSVPWHERYSRKYALKCQRFDEWGIDPGRIDIEQLSRFISENGSYMKCRRETFQHDDYHPANLIVNGGRLAG